jgi:hypothetical protein
MKLKVFWKYVEEPHHFRKINGWLTVLWFVAAFPICIFLANSVPFLVFVSVYAVVTGHLATWQAARVEVEQERSADKTRDVEEADFLELERKVANIHSVVFDVKDDA